MTDGVLLGEVLRDRLVSNYSVRHAVGFAYEESND
jgi:hypothetical protein